MTQRAPNVLPREATQRLSESIEASLGKTSHQWRDVRPENPDGTVNAYVEIPRGDRRKWEFDMRENARAIDRVIPRAIGGYPVNYGFVPQTVFHDGDPFDALVLGPALPGGRIARGVVVGLMVMEDAGLADSKVVVSPVGASGQPLYRLTPRDEQRIGAFFERYKRHEPGASTGVPGWGSAADGLEHIRVAHAFFKRCASHAGASCTVEVAGMK
jgi:inorganic pyrophosphatase